MGYGGSEYREKVEYLEKRSIGEGDAALMALILRMYYRIDRWEALEFQRKDVLE